jgi:S-formylglutathione hydrolase FrmB
MQRLFKALALTVALTPAAMGITACSSAPTGLSDADPETPGGADRSLPWVTPSVQAAGIQRVIFESEAVGAPVSYHIFLPEAYLANPEKSFPVLYWLHGTGGGLGGIGPISAFLAAGMVSGKTPPFLVVFPNGLTESMWTNSHDGRIPMETVVVRDLLNHVDATFRTVARREGRILEGFSMGGRGAGRLGFRYPELFAAVSMLGAGPLDPDFMGPRAQLNPEERARIFQTVWGGDIEKYRADGPEALATLHQETLRGERSIRLRIALGALDFVLADNQALTGHLTSLGIPHALFVIPGVGHQTLPLLQGLGDAGWRFYREALSGFGG